MGNTRRVRSTRISTNLSIEGGESFVSRMPLHEGRTALGEDFTSHSTHLRRRFVRIRGRRSGGHLGDFIGPP